MALHKTKKDFTFSKRASAYDDGFEGRASQRFYRLLQREMDLKPGCSLIDVGCGTGMLLSRLAQAAEFNGYGIDVEEAMASRAKQKCPQMDIRCCRSEATPFEDGSFDALVACMAYHHFDDKPGFAREAARILKDGAVLYIADPRLAFPIRKALNGILRHVGVVGEFYSVEETASNFSAYGFSLIGYCYDGYAQLVKLQKKPASALA